MPTLQTLPFIERTRASNNTRYHVAHTAACSSGGNDGSNSGAWRAACWRA